MAERSKRFVVDSSFVLSFLLPEESNNLASDIFSHYMEGSVQLISTVLLPFEVLNSLRTALIRRKISEGSALRFGELFLNLKITLVEVSEKDLLDLSLRRNLTVYDAAYLQLAIEKRWPLLTFDNRLKDEISKTPNLFL